MFEFVGWILANQIYFIFIGFCVGALITAILGLKASRAETWRIADLVWITAGGFATFCAVLASIFLSDTNELSRRIDLAEADLENFHNSTIEFVFKRCSPDGRVILIPIASESVELICDSANYLSRNTEDSRGLAQFVEYFRRQGSDPESKFSDLPFDDFMEMAGVNASRLRNFDADPVSKLDNILDIYSKSDIFRSLVPRNTALEAAERLINLGVFSDLAHEYLVLDRAYERIKVRFAELQLAWNENEVNRKFIFIRLCSIFVLAIVFPLRVGKSVFEIGQVVKGI